MNRPLCKDEVFERVPLEEQTRSWLVKFVAVACALAMAVATIIDWQSGHWTAVATTWYFVGPLMGMLFARYFYADRHTRVP